jgi:hypothetical protein
MVCGWHDARGGESGGQCGGCGALAEDECVQIVSIMTDHNYANSYHFTICHSKLLRLRSKRVDVLAPMIEDMIAQRQG